MLRPKVTVAAIIENERGEILLEKRKIEPFKNYWALPGGHIEACETAKKAVRREVEEETGIKIKPKFLFYQDEIFPEISWHAVALVFYSKVKKAKLFPQRKEVSELKWFKIKDAVRLKLAFKAREALKKLIILKHKVTNF